MSEKKISYVETHKHPEEFVTIIERYEPCSKDDKSVAFFGHYPNWTPMKLVHTETITE